MKKVLRSLAVIFAILFIFSIANVKVFAEEIVVDGGVISTLKSENATLFDAEGAKSIGFSVDVSGNDCIIKKGDLKFTFTNNSNIAKVNDVSFKLIEKSKIIGGKFCVPLRFFFETLNYEVLWNNGATNLKEKKLSGYPITFKNEDKTYTIPKEPEKIVSMAPDITETIFRIGAGSKLVGRTKYCNFPEEAKKVEEIGSMYEPNLEKIVSLKPDLVMAATHFKEEHLKKLEEGKINTFAKATPDSIEETFNNILTIGGIVNKNYEAHALVSSMKEKVNYAKLLTKDLKKPTAYYVVGTGDGGEFTYGGDTFFNDLITIAGAKNVASEVKGYNYTIEQLVKSNPQYIFGEEFAKKTMEGNNYKKLTGKFITVESQDPFSRPTERAVTVALPAMIKAMHPEISDKIDF